MRWFDRRRPRPAPADPVAAAADAYNREGAARAEAGDVEAALAAFAAALALAPRHVAAITNVGNLCLESGALDDAVVHYEAALRIDDGAVLAQRHLGIALRRLGRRGAAVRALRRADRLAMGGDRRRAP